MVRDATFSWIEGLQELQPGVLVDQEKHSNKNCPRTIPKHLFDLRKKAIIQVLLSRSRESGGSSRSTVSKGLLNLLTVT